MSDVLSYLKNRILLLDGGMGTLLQARGMRPGEYPERWNLTHPDVVKDIHRAYFDAGSNVVCSNTFGANPLKFSEEELEGILRAAYDNARTAAEQSSRPGPKFIALDIGPSGRMLKPYGDLAFEDAVRAFGTVVRLARDIPFDLILIETMNDSLETKAALLAAKENSALPVFVSNAYGVDGKLMTGASPAAMVALLSGMGADAIGVNCSLGPKALEPVVREYLRLSPLPVLLKPNAGLPRAEGDRTVYDVLPGEFAADTARLVQMGVRIAGGCCGTTPDYIRALAEAIGDRAPTEREVEPKAVVSSYTNALCLDDRPVLIGERINPTGKKRLKAALIEGDMAFVLSEAARQQEKGAMALDVNAGLPELNEKEVLPRLVQEIQTVTDLPLCIDTAAPEAMAAALRVYNGKAIVNSVNGKEESLRAILPLVKKYGGVVIALTLDETGIPDTAEGRLGIARRILKAAEGYGIGCQDILFDPLAMTIGASPDAARVTLETVERITRELGCRTSLGVSNVSFGLPERDYVNAAFFTMALSRGLSAAIMNPESPRMLGAYRAYLALNGQDPQCGEYVAFAARNPLAAPASNAEGPGAKETAEQAGLARAVDKGMRAQAAAEAKRMLSEEPPMQLIQREIIPALDRVGQGYEQGKVFLPQLLMSAEAASAAFEVIKAAAVAAREETPVRARVVLATVRGDIHDIGKNIVRLLMENYGFQVTDLGKDVPPEQVLDAVLRLKAPVCGLSALMTTTVPAMEETVRLIHEQAPFCRVIVGGAVLTQEYADQIGADFYAADAMEGVRYAESLE